MNGTALAETMNMPNTNYSWPTLPLDQLHHARELTRELNELLRRLQLSSQSEMAADAAEAALAANAATRTLLRRACHDMEQVGAPRCRIGPDGVAELCDGCGMYLSLCVCHHEG